MRLGPHTGRESSLGRGLGEEGSGLGVVCPLQSAYLWALRPSRGVGLVGASSPA